MTDDDRAGKLADALRPTEGYIRLDLYQAVLGVIDTDPETYGYVPLSQHVHLLKDFLQATGTDEPVGYSAGIAELGYEGDG